MHAVKSFDLWVIWKVVYFEYFFVGWLSTIMRETLIKAGKVCLGVVMTTIPGMYAFREAVGYVARVDGISMQVC